MRRTSRLAGVALAAMVAAACGGGGDARRSGGIDPNLGGPAFDPAPGVDFDVAAAWRNFLSAARQWTVTGTGSDGNAYTVTIDATPAADAVFPPTGVATAVHVTTLQIEGGGRSQRVVRTMFLDASTGAVTGLAWEGEAPGEICDVPVEIGTPPAAARIPSSGTLARLERRADCAAGSAPATASVLFAWSLHQVDGINLFCLDRDVEGVADPPRQHCAEVSPDGTLGRGAFVSLELEGGASLRAVAR